MRELEAGVSEDAGTDRPIKVVWIAVALSLVGVVLGLLVYWRRKLSRQPAPVEVESPLPSLSRIQGLSDAEAAARYAVGPRNTIAWRPRRTARDIWRDSVFNLFNLNLLFLFVFQLLLRQYLDALLSVAAMAVTLGLRIFQRMRAKKRLDQIERETRPKVTVIRQGAARSVDASEIVRGDVVVVGPGDSFPADGTLLSERQILVDESMLEATRGRQRKGKGGEVYAGSFCARGRAIFVVERIGAAIRFASILRPDRPDKRAHTPLQLLIANLLRGLLVIVTVLLAVSVVRFLSPQWMIVEEVYLQSTSLLLRLAPGGLFFTTVVAYAVGTIRLADVGALVRRAESVESLANVSVLCLGRTSAITGIRAEIEPIDPVDGGSELDVGRIRQILGDYARSTSVQSTVSRALVDSFDGSPRHVRDEAPFMLLHGWSALAFDDDDLRGVYVLGDAALLAPHLLPRPEKAPEAEAELQATRSSLRHLASRFGGFLGRRKQARAEATDHAEPAPADHDTGQGRSPSEDVPPPDERPLRRLFHRIGGRLRPPEPKEDGKPDEETAASSEMELLFAYRPDLCPLYDSAGSAQLPRGLTPLCQVSYSRHVRSGTRETLHAFTELGVDIKVLSSEPPYQVAAAMRQVGLVDEDEPLGIISGPELKGLSPDQLSAAAYDNAILGQLDADLKSAVVRALRARGEYVALVSDGVDDVAALQQADLGITTRNGHQAALVVADTVLLKDRLQVLLGVLEQGQRVVNSVVDMIKLSLSQVLYMAVLIAAVRLLVQRLPYKPAQLSYVWVFAQAIPSILLILWAESGALSARSMRRRLVHFVFPAGLTLGLAGLGVYYYVLSASQSTPHAQSALTYALMWAGLLLILFVQPPTRAWVGGDRLSGDPRYVRAVVVLFLVAMLFSAVPLTRWIFQIELLPRLVDYGIVGGAVMLWALVLRSVWRLLVWWRKGEIAQDIGRPAPRLGKKLLG
jgi:magnesium-transporting ATPase (P-type)